ncbi:MAG: phosphoribosylglycinamide formyltransferase [Bacteroidales bacterium]|nr:phosphoribosylglycinamide formyltransferase [Bacteroidales bacterium]
MNKNIAIFASGSGSNAEKIIQYFKARKTAQVVCVFSNKSDAYVLERAQKQNIPAQYFPLKDWRQPDIIIQKLEDLKVDYIILAGFLLRIPQELIDRYPNKIINIHPALLPKFGGKGMYGKYVHEAVIKAQEKESGITIHYIDENYDEGTTLFQAKCKVLPNDTPDSLAEKVHQLEHEYFPKVIEQIITAK